MTSSITDLHERLLLADLFASFEIDPKKRLPLQHHDKAFEELYQLQTRISGAPENQLNARSARYIDFIVTKQWMRTILWQSSLSQDN